MKRHRFDPFSFLFGALFVVIGATFVFGSSGPQVARPERMWAAATIVVGASILVWAVARVVRKEPSATATHHEDMGALTAGSDDTDVASVIVTLDEGSGETDSS
jgi:lysylphosphatidylglycerol synthetase-like protein (DUF2156 family)